MHRRQQMIAKRGRQETQPVPTAKQAMQERPTSHSTVLNPSFERQVRTLIERPKSAQETDKTTAQTVVGKWASEVQKQAAVRAEETIEDTEENSAPEDPVSEAAAVASVPGTDMSTEADAAASGDQPVDGAYAPPDGTVLLKIITPVGSLYHVRADDWHNALECGFVNVDLCDAYGKRSKSTSRQLRPKDRLRVVRSTPTAGNL